MKTLLRKLLPRKKDAVRLERATSAFLRITLFSAFLFALSFGQWTTVFLSLLALSITFLPLLIEKEMRFEFPTELIFLIDLFVFSALFWGSIHNFYEIFWWWDIALHGSFGIIAGLAGFLILYTLYTQRRFRASPATMLLFAFSFAIALGALWEIFEYGMDVFTGSAMQTSEGTGVHDTMQDIIAGTFGALVTCFTGYLYVIFRR